MRREFFKSFFHKNKNRLIAGLLLCSSAPTLLFAETKAAVEPDFMLTGKTMTADNYIRLDWSIPGSSNKSFKVYQKKPGSTAFQSISSTNLDSAKQVRVLNVYPDFTASSGSTMSNVSFTTWDGESITTKSSAKLKQWMEQPNSENPKGYGKGLIEVTPVSIDNFNANPELYLKGGTSEYKYDVIVFGIWDANASRDISVAAYNSTAAFLDSGRGVLFGHDTMRGWITNFAKLKDKVNMELSTDSSNPGPNFSGTTINISRKGMLTNYPWDIGSVGTTLTITSSHTVTQKAFGDVWMKFGSSADNDVRNFYLTSWNNAAMIQTGHTSGAATSDEQKLLANTIFYLNQLSSDMFLDDYSGQDVSAPDKPSVKISSATTSQLKFQFDAGKDNGSEYSYYVTAEDNAMGTIYQSNTATNTITSGFKGFSYVLDQSPTTIPGDIVNHKSGELTISNLDLNKTYYLHVKAIDNQGNASETYHLKVNTSKPLAPILNMSRETWGTENASFNIKQQHNKSYKIISISNSETQPYISKLKSLGYNITEKAGFSDINEIMKYDLVISDAHCWSVVNPSLINQLYQNGVKMITVGNDTGVAIYPITGDAEMEAPYDLSTNRIVKNEASFNFITVLGGNDGGSKTIKGVVSEARVLYRQKQNNNPAIIEVNNGRGGVWVHSQAILGLTYSPSQDEFYMGLVDYVMGYVSQFHVTDVQYKIDNGEWISYNGGDIPITTEGLHTVSIRNVDARGVYSDLVTKTVGIDRTSPFFTVSAPAITTSRTVKVSLDGMGDSLSGIKNVRVSSYSDFKDTTGYTTVSGKTSESVNVTIPFLADLDKNYSTRTIYVELFDNVGNSKVMTCTTKYEAKAPEVPLVITPTPNSFYLDKEKVNVCWLYNDANNDGVKIPQSKATVTFVNIDTDKTYTYEVKGNVSNYNIATLDEGEYTVSVEVFNTQDKSAVSKPVTFRYNTHDTKGNVNSNFIAKGTPIRFVSIISRVELPKDTGINGYIYYALKSSDDFVETKKVEFNIVDKLSDENVVKLPEKAEKIMVKYDFYSKSSNKTISPAIDDITIYAK